VRLEPADVEAIAQRVAELLSPPGQPVRYVDAARLAKTLGVERDWVYAHACQLGAIRLGGPQGRLRFDLHHVQQTLADREPTSDRKALLAGTPRGAVPRGRDWSFCRMRANVAQDSAKWWPGGVGAPPAVTPGGVVPMYEKRIPAPGRVG